MAVAGAGNSCFRYQKVDGKLKKLSTRQEVSTETTNNMEKILERLDAGEIAYVHSRYPTPDLLRKTWVERGGEVAS